MGHFLPITLEEGETIGVGAGGCGTIIYMDYSQWIQELRGCYHISQIKATVKVYKVNVDA